MCETVFQMYGVVPPMITPFQENGELDIEALKILVDFLSDNVDGLFINGSYGGGVLMTEEEREKVAETAIQTAEGRVPVIVQVGTADSLSAARLADHAAANGAAAVAAVGPYYFKHSTEEILNYFDALVRAAKGRIPVYVYNNPQFQGYPMDLDAVSEFERVRHELEVILGTIVTEEKLEMAFAVYEEYRQAMREFAEVSAAHPEIITARKRHLIIKAGQFMDKAAYTSDVKEITEGLKREAPSDFRGTKVIVTGLLSEPVEILDIFDENGIAIVGDDLSMGSRLFRTPAVKQGTVFERMARMIADQDGDTFYYDPDKKKGRMLIDLVREKGADAVVVMMMKFCDPEEYDYPIYKKELADAGIPELYLEIDQQLATFEQIHTRVQSFSEMFL